MFDMSGGWKQARPAGAGSLATPEVLRFESPRLPNPIIRTVSRLMPEISDTRSTFAGLTCQASLRLLNMLLETLPCLVSKHR